MKRSVSVWHNMEVATNLPVSMFNVRAFVNSISTILCAHVICIDVYYVFWRSISVLRAGCVNRFAQYKVRRSPDCLK